MAAPASGAADANKKRKRTENNDEHPEPTTSKKDTLYQQLKAKSERIADLHEDISELKHKYHLAETNAFNAQRDADRLQNKLDLKNIELNDQKATSNLVRRLEKQFKTRSEDFQGQTKLAESLLKKSLEVAQGRIDESDLDVDEEKFVYDHFTVHGPQWKTYAAKTASRNF